MNWTAEEDKIIIKYYNMIKAESIADLLKGRTVEAIRSRAAALRKTGALKKKRINSNQKGKAGEREFANLCNEYGFSCRRSQQYAGINNDADVVGLPDIHIEVKRVQSLNIDKAMDKTMQDKKEEEYGIVAHRKDGRPWLVTMVFEEWIEIYKMYLIAQDK